MYIQTDDTNLIIDTGPDFRQQVLREKIRDLDAVLFTHEHKDHTAGMDDIRGFNFSLKKDIPIYARSRVIDQLQKEFSYIFQQDPYPGVPRVEVKELDGSPFRINNTDIIPIEVLHLKLPVYGFRIGDLTYITDANHISEEEKEKIRGSKVLILNALQIREHISHFNLEEALAMVEELAPEMAYFTHISHKMGMHRHVKDLLPPNVELAFDGLQITL